MPERLQRSTHGRPTIYACLLRSTPCYLIGMETPNSLPIHIRVSAERHAALSQLAREERRPLATMIAILVEEAMDARSRAGQAPAVWTR